MLRGSIWVNKKGIAALSGRIWITCLAVVSSYALGGYCCVLAVDAGK